MLQGIGNVAVHRPGGKQVELLEDHADPFSLLPQLLVVQGGQVGAADDDFALRGPLQKIDAPGQRGLSRAGESDDPGDGTLLNFQTDILDRLYCLLSIGKAL